MRKEPSATLRPGLWGRWLGVGAGAFALTLHVTLLFFNPYSDVPPELGTYALFGFMSLFAILAIWASWNLKPIWLVAAFIGAFLPMGLILLVTVSFFSLIGVANILYLVAALGISSYNRAFSR
ncbi:MAG: hypothetical protein IT330_04520 [Anaerolineae bacterium]|nr:hypothetical protein [Anaerolineae bacterium]